MPVSRARKLLVALSLCAYGAAAKAADPFWPDIDTPPGAQVQTIAPDVMLNGQRSRILQIDVSAGTETLAAFYRKRFGARRVENTMGDTVVIATREGGFFHTVQIRRRDAQGAQATVVSTSMAQPISRSKALQDTQSWLPADTAVVQSMESVDGGVRSVTMTAANAQSVQANRDLLLQASQQRGFRLVREEKVPAARPALSDGISLWLESPQEHAMVVVADVSERRALSIVRTREIK